MTTTHIAAPKKRKCPSLRRLFDKKTSSSAKEEIREHIAGCGDCIARLAKASDTVGERFKVFRKRRLRDRGLH